jgi:protein-L-isoaspartate(D-aspartate) O-methyltransferase
MSELLEADQVLRNAMVKKLKLQGYLTDPIVERAMLSVPRHKFAHWLSLEQAHDFAAHPLPGTTEQTMSTISNPNAVAVMLEPLELQAGHRVLEIGAGSGYNAALIAQIVGESGHVTTVDIENFIVQAARVNLAATGFERVEVILGDGGLGYAPRAPFDRITATVGAWEIPLEWFDQLAPNGRIAAPLHLSGDPSDHEYVVLEHEGNHLSGHVTVDLAMVLMRGGTGAHPEKPEAKTPGGPSVLPKHIRLKVFKKSDPEAPKPQALEVHGDRARKVLEKKLTVIELDIEVDLEG